MSLVTVFHSFLFSKPLIYFDTFCLADFWDLKNAFIFGFSPMQTYDLTGLGKRQKDKIRL